MEKEYSLPEISIKYKSGNFVKKKISNSRDCAEILRTLFDSDTIEYQESVIVIYLNKANETIGWYKASVGGMSMTIIDPRVIFSVGIQSGASSIIISHNHPSGNKNPSEADIQSTIKLIKGGEILDIKVLDHLIITPNSYLSMADEGSCIF